MPRYWLDASIYIDAHKDRYPIGVVDSYWKWLAGQIENGVIVSPKPVYKEVVEGSGREDELTKWFQNRKDKGLCVAASQAVTDQVGKILEYVFTKYQAHQALDFARGADPWIIAHALVEGGVVVTHESSLHSDAHKARIPDVCKHFEVRCMNGMQMMKELKAKI